ncbi:MAG: D-alanine--D-alanine ligase A, partial [Chloroflexota bacterium]
MSNKKLNLGIIFGGRSGEHAVSLMSARFIISVIDLDKYNVVEIGITRDGEWWTGENVLQALINEHTKGLSPATLLATPGRNGLHQIKENKSINLISKLDVVFP